VIVAGVLIASAAPLHWGMRWGATADERARVLSGDDYLTNGRRARVAMTRAISIDAPPDVAWPWIAQLGRGAGWYSIDWIDNGRRKSARHIVSWIPEPRVGDATAIGYLRAVERGRCMVWWANGVRFAGARARLVVHYGLASEAGGTRLIARMSADATGITAWPALLIFAIMDSIMARAHLLGIRARVERRSATAADSETGARDQYQLYEVLYADGGGAGVVGKEQTARWRQAAIDDGVLPALRSE